MRVRSGGLVRWPRGRCHRTFTVVCAPHSFQTVSEPERRVNTAIALRTRHRHRVFQVLETGRRYTFELFPNPEKKRRMRPDARSTVVDVVTPYQLERPFLEIDWCWGYIGYVNMLRYHVESEEEVPRTKKWSSPRDARNADIALDEAKLTDLLTLALTRTEHSVAQRGSGDLSAYAVG